MSDAADQALERLYSRIEDQLRAVMRARHLNRQRLSERMGRADTNTVDRALAMGRRGNRRGVRLATLVKLATALGVEIDVVFRGAPVDSGDAPDRD